MTKEKYYAFREDVGIYDTLLERYDWIRRILEVYPIKDMTLAEAKDYFMDAATEMESRIQKQLNVE